jgi:hypothetical protein
MYMSSTTNKLIEEGDDSVSQEANVGGKDGKGGGMNLVM